jgi:4-hydroxy-tetrahydrodipicolinate reductase
MTPWVWPAMKQNPPYWLAPITEACQEGDSSCFTTGIDPGFANDLFPMTLMGLCSEVRVVRALEILDYLTYEGDYEDEMGIGRPPEYKPLLEHTDILVMAWGATVPMMAHAVGIELDEITTTWTSG